MLHQTKCFQVFLYVVIADKTYNVEVFSDWRDRRSKCGLIRKQEMAITSSRLTWSLFKLYHAQRDRIGISIITKRRTCSIAAVTIKDLRFTYVYFQVLSWGITNGHRSIDPTSSTLIVHFEIILSTIYWQWEVREMRKR